MSRLSRKVKIAVVDWINSRKLLYLILPTLDRKHSYVGLFNSETDKFILWVRFSLLEWSKFEAVAAEMNMDIEEFFVHAIKMGIRRSGVV